MTLLCSANAIADRNWAGYQNVPTSRRLACPPPVLGRPVLDHLTSPLFYAVAIPAVFTVGLSKGGFSGVGMLALPLMALVMPPLQAAAIMLPILIVQDMIGIWAFRRTWDRRNLAIMLPGAVVGILAGYLLAAELSASAVELALGLICIAFGLRQLHAQITAGIAPAVRPGILFGLLCGAASGFTSMIAQAGAPPVQIYLVPQRLPRDHFVGTILIFFAAVNWIKVPPFIALGQFSLGTLITTAALMPLAIVSIWIGIWLVRRVSGPAFFVVIYLLLILVGVQLTYNGMAGLS